MARQPFAAGALGGLVVLVFGLIAVAAGWVGQEKRTTITQTPIAATTSSSSDSGLTVGQIYDQDGPGVVFIRAQVVQRTQSLFGFQDQQQGEATGSGLVIDDSGDILTNAHVVDGASKIDRKSVV